MTVVHLVRHGVTQHTGHKLSGWMTGVHLTKEGRDQADAAADRLEGVPLKAFYSSPLERCHETAEIIARRHKGAKVKKIRALGEVEYGAWTNRSLKALSKTKLWTTVQRWPSQMRFPEGETLRAVQARAVDAMEDLVTRHPKQHICCATHADVIKLLVAHYIGAHLDMYQRITVGPSSITVLGLGEGEPRLLALNILPSGGTL